MIVKSCNSKGQVIQPDPGLLIRFGCSSVPPAKKAGHPGMHGQRIVGAGFNKICTAPRYDDRS